MRPYLLLLACLFCCTLFSCRERYGLPIEPSLNGLLVVEGNILQDDTTIIRLSRTTAVAETGLLSETGATVIIEGDDNSSFILSEADSGKYIINPIHLNPTSKYRLNISTKGKVYQSAFTSIISTPDIDSVSWVRNNGVEIFVNATGKEGDTRFFKWDYDEVWDFYSILRSTLYYNGTMGSDGKFVCDSQLVNGVMTEKCVERYIVRQPEYYNDSMYHCWKYVTSGRVHLGSTTSLSSNVVYEPIRKIDNNGFELTSLYSILVKQTGLSQEGYNFYQLLKRNTEQLGSIFDAQPNQLKTNIQCVTDPTERAIGFVDVTTVKRKRIFISKDDVAGWDYYPYAECQFSYDTVLYHNAVIVDSLIKNDLLPINPWNAPEPPDFFVGSFFIMSKFCLDCRERGVYKKPDFWPY